MSTTKKGKTFAADQKTLTNTPERREFTVASDISSENPFKSNAYYPGDSVNEHKELEKANLDIAEDELRQQNENNSLD
ncbi:hypothetical protein [Evansella cellulosilytica]|uniref:Uncharacterized protein n=1 Tax=Evansella cellulosilytica (strain ATCC 21833 / DSM 2522 / FERM P-1141 / JCM 9156 / N-4) TaxID=649639 RepID=E6TU97_EVAC2|nr:hypothetical protein [Evansella cellulosilytica]ADU28557.1 hypothetical protein Bcell_0270 [Evansella cellulosilytica DSM 2522]